MSLLGLTAFVAFWIALTIWPLRYLADAARIRELGGHVALGHTDLGLTGVPYVLFCRFTERDADLPCILTVDEGCPISAPVLEIAGRIPTFTKLDLSRSDVDDHSFAQLAPLRRVQHLHVQGRPLTNASMAIVGDWRDLRSASFHGTDIDDFGVLKLAGCDRLTELSLRSTHVSDDAVDTLSSFTQLQRLDVSRCELSNAAIKRLRSTLPDCDVDTVDPWLVEAEQ
ncbi:MAG: hypothetical protein ACF787_08010 [Rhodopirellula sp. JB053]